MNAPVRRLHWGCGENAVPGWINADRRERPGVTVIGDIRDGLPLESASIDYIVSIHALQDLPYFDVVPALAELRRLLVPGGVLRLGLPDMDRASPPTCGTTATTSTCRTAIARRRRGR